MDEYGITWYDYPKSGMRIQEISNPPVICWGACSGASPIWRWRFTNLNEKNRRVDTEAAFLLLASRANAVFFLPKLRRCLEPC